MLLEFCFLLISLPMHLRIHKTAIATASMHTNRVTAATVQISTMFRPLGAVFVASVVSVDNQYYNYNC